MCVRLGARHEVSSAVLSVWGAVAAAVVVLPMAVSSWGESKLAQVEDPFPAVDCTAYDTGKSVADKHSDACRSFVQLVNAKDATLPLLIGPVYACFGINDELFVIDTSVDQAKNENKEWAARAEPRFAFYRLGIESGLTNLSPPLTMEGKWNLSFSPGGIVSYSGTTDSKIAKEMEQANPGLKIPRVTLSIDQEQIALGDFRIQFATGRFTYWTDPLGLGKNVQLPGQCAVFKRDSSRKGDVLHFSWKKTD